MQALKKLFAPIDMTEGKPWEKILFFAIPLLIGNIVQQLYSTVDSIVVGKYVGDNALSAVGSAGPIVNLLIVLFVGISMGATIKVSHYFGARDKEGLSYTIGNSFTLTILASVAVMILGVLVSRPLLILLKTPASILDWCTSYLHIIFISIAGMAFYNILGGILRGLGDSVSSLVYLVIASILNIVLDILFVAEFNMGVNGVALATAIAQTVSAILCARRLYKMKDLFEIRKKYFRLSHYAKGVITLGIPSGITQAILSVSMIAVQALTNSFGEMLIAANVIVMRVDGFAMLPNFSFGNAMTTFTGQNVGAQKIDRVHTGAKQGTLLILAVSTVITGCILLFGRGLMSVFTNTPELVDLSMRLMSILAIGYIAMAVLQSLSGIMRGAGDTVTPMWISLITTVAIRVPVAYGISFLTRTAELPYGRSECIQISLLCSWVLGAVLTFFFYKLGRWKKKALK